MSDYLIHAGPLIWLVLVLGILGLVAATQYALRQRGRLASVALGATAASLVTALLGTLTGIQLSIGGLGEVAAEKRWIFLVGLSESLNNMVVALVFAWLVSLLLMIGAYRREDLGQAH